MGTQSHSMLPWATKISRWGVWGGGILTLLSAGLVCFDVIVRKLFAISVGGADELSGYAFAISTTWSLALVVLERANVRVDILYQHFSVRVAAMLDWLSLVALAVFLTMLTRYAYEVLATSWIQNSFANTPLATPLWIPQGLWFVGLIWMVIVLALMLTRASSALITGDYQSVNSLAGARLSKEEALEEAQAGQRRVQEERGS
ncbi:TRAP transporter small permease [Alcaligenaceae bacterium LF4-65]|jgi:TRAP-type mannitol/chloroaromatic compound transport system permease small subunit|uniref:TRAP transporter small permease protein n=1 Tax=Zwartia hollandica TaxID=324606 RepID=A0A953NBZ9_9BURK|nr:TRAP transporter small permease [Zwartia hollandica]MBZ1350505.1 TRAP transporter small permease [Zwartia hollandica]